MVGEAWSGKPGRNRPSHSSATCGRSPLNIGDTGISDNDLVAYLDDVQIATTSETTTYDFEASPATKDDCKNGGWAAFGFPNQGACVSSLQANGNADK